MDLSLLEISDGQASGEPSIVKAVLGVPGNPTWSLDGKSIVFSNLDRLWRVAAMEGAEPEVLEFAGVGSHHPAISSQGQLVYAQSERDSNIWESELVRPGAEAEQPKRLIA